MTKRGLYTLILLSAFAGAVQADDFPDKYLQLHDKATTDAAAQKQLQGMADKGDAIAQYCLASLYDASDPKCKQDLTAEQKVTTVKQDPKAAMKWYERSAMQGNGYAAEQMADMYLGDVEGVPGDLVKAAQWLMVAIDVDPNGGGFNASLDLGTVSSQMTQEQLGEARAGAKKIEAKIHHKH